MGGVGVRDLEALAFKPAGRRTDSPASPPLGPLLLLLCPQFVCTKGMKTDCGRAEIDLVFPLLLV